MAPSSVNLNIQSYFIPCHHLYSPTVALQGLQQRSVFPQDFPLESCELEMLWIEPECLCCVALGYVPQAPVAQIVAFGRRMNVCLRERARLC